MKGILSIQSWVAYGHAGNAAAMFPLQRLGFEVWAVNTVQFSNHTGYGSWQGDVFSADQIRAVIQGIAERGAFANCAAILTGYTGDPSLGAIVMGAVEAVKAANPQAIWCCDPVMGDVGRGFFVRAGLPEYFRDHAMAEADIVTPNQFELEYLAGHDIRSLDDALGAARALIARGPRLVLVTSLLHADTPADQIEMLAVTGDGAWLVATPKLPISVNGAGDVVAASFLGHWLRHRDTELALRLTAAAIYQIVEATHKSGERELQLIAAQDAFIAPHQLFDTVRIA